MPEYRKGSQQLIIASPHGHRTLRPSYSYGTLQGSRSKEADSDFLDPAIQVPMVGLSLALPDHLQHWGPKQM